MSDLDKDLGERNCNKVSIRDIEITKNAKITVGLAIQKIASECVMEPKELYGYMEKNLYYCEDDGGLMFVFDVPDIGSMFVEIPYDHWKFKGENNLQ